MISFNTFVCLIVVSIAVQIHSLPQTQQKSTNGKPKRQPPTADELVQINGETVSHKFLDVFCSNMV